MVQYLVARVLGFVLFPFLRRKKSVLSVCLSVSELSHGYTVWLKKIIFFFGNTTPQKPASDSESLQNFMVWKLIRIDFEVTSEVFQQIYCMIKFLSGWHFIYTIHQKILSYTTNLKKLLKWFYFNPKELRNHLVAFVVYWQEGHGARQRINAQVFSLFIAWSWVSHILSLIHVYRNLLPNMFRRLFLL